MTVRELAASVDDVVRPVGQVDPVLLYAVVADAAADYLGDRELCGKIHIPDGPVLLKRGSELEPLTAAMLADAVDRAFLELRDDPGHLDDVRDQLSTAQERVWQYFYPRKYSEFLYATNHEGEGRPIDRVFFDIDRGSGTSAHDALAAARAFVDALDGTVDVPHDRVIAWTGASFHVELLLPEERPASFYHDRIFDPGSDDTVTAQAVAAVDEQVDVPVRQGHEKADGAIIVDPSQTPSGKLNRVPLGSLHLADATTVDGVSVPLTRDELFADGVLDRLQAYTPEQVVDEIDTLAEKL